MMEYWNNPLNFVSISFLLSKTGMKHFGTFLKKIVMDNIYKASVASYTWLVFCLLSVSMVALCQAHANKIWGSGESDQKPMLKNLTVMAKFSSVPLWLPKPRPCAFCQNGASNQRVKIKRKRRLENVVKVKYDLEQLYNQVRWLPSALADRLCNRRVHISYLL